MLRKIDLEKLQMMSYRKYSTPTTTTTNHACCPRSEYSKVLTNVLLAYA